MSSAYSLRNRLSLALAVGVTLVWMAGVTVCGLVVRHELDEAYDSALQEMAQRLLSLAVIDILDHQETLSARRVAALKPHDEFLTYVVRDGAGKILLHSHDADRDVFPEKPRTGFNTTPTHRIYGESAVSDSIFIEVAEPLRHRREAAFESTIALVLPLALFLPLGVIGVWWLVRRNMKPVIGLGEQIKARSAGDLSPLNTARLPDEIEPIRHAVNDLMERLQRSLDVERSFTANSAHELRTPIAGALAQTQRLISVLDDDERRIRAEAIESSLQRLARISEKLMQLARAEGGGIVTAAPADLGAVLDATVDEFARNIENGERLNYANPDAGTLISNIDADAFSILMRNLIENALKHSPPGSAVEIVAEDGQVRVINAGAALPNDDLISITERFSRGPTETEGSGLGLAIAAAIAENGNIHLDFKSPATGRTDGFEAIVVLPSITGGT
ncbi:MAG: two-component sensor histidine kinase [Rhodospirillales bacterium]|nr:two-component sensor histidine kinase [Rhodospirillales bacterium]